LIRGEDRAGRGQHFLLDLPILPTQNLQGPQRLLGGEKTGQTSSAWHWPSPPGSPPHSLPQGAQRTLSPQRPGLRSGTVIGTNCRRQPSGPGAKGRYEKERKEQRQAGGGGVMRARTPHWGPSSSPALLLPTSVTLDKALTPL
jgi:hypothetical protein